MIKCRKGFSLIEMLIVCAIIAVLSLITVPAFLRYTANANLKSAVREITSDISLMKERAISRNLQQKIVFAVGSESYTLQEDSGGWTTIQTKLLTSFGSNIDITNAAFFHGAVIFFQTRGTADNGKVQLSNSRGSTATITTNITGRTYVTYTMQ